MYLSAKMNLRWRKQTHWPPSPCVEDEIVSLSRELHGLSQLGERPGVEGVCSRGTVDQHPVLVDVLSYSSYSQTTVFFEDTYRDSGSDDNVGPLTPTDERQDPMLYYLGGDQAVPLSAPLAAQKPYPLPSKPAVRTEVPTRGYRPSLVETSAHRDSTSKKPVIWNPEAPTRGRPGRADTHVQRDIPPKRDTAQSSRTPPTSSKPRPPAVQSKSTTSSPQRPVIVKHGRSIDTLASKSGYQSDTAATKPKKPGQPEPQTDKTEPPADKKPSISPSLAARLEEKIRQRQELRASKETSQGDALAKASPSPPAAAQPRPPIQHAVTEPPVASFNPVPQRPAPTSQPRSSSLPREPTTDRHAEANVVSSSSTAAPAPVPQRPPLGDIKPVARSVSSDRGESSAQLPARRAVSFLDQVPQRSSSLPRTTEDAPERPLLPPRRSSSQGPARQTSPRRQFFLSPCPRSIAVAGYQDWHTIKGLPHLDICPSCMKQMRKSKFRDLFILGSPRPRGEKVRCSMSEAWTRLAWMQTLKKQLDHLDLLHQITRSSSIKPCSGRTITDQHWYRVVDPETDMYLPQFNVCSGCIRNLRALMPQHRDTFKRGSVKQERACDFVTDSPRFVRYIDCLDMAANRAELEHTLRPDVSEFLSYARRKVVLRDCRRDRPILSTWHYMPQLPELTVCEDCYDDAVWPYVKAKQPIARRFSTAMRLLPGDGPSRCREATCQLYSPRMRAKFQEAVQLNDLTYLKRVALRRCEAEQLFRVRQEELLEDASRGYDVEGELRKNVEEWKRCE
ncbi:hypothetical protein BO70DRAFT_361271 [Aspergillus heteromorphus CBS 117.55]|uniref:Uncharacterized protein n=1 Tax=Aspergillus heteromorphus CBS 117.55 TaxID=1448321 RepID=A0A317WFZ4_9EURO|nr:uncharacterized protein BO70DRAFT_361271 [Aspergillus heteromorphus CBS 117.55]PWY84885.1 hypothetical protein BO70DRAFT_361271 [Aspergillus heteromorphus CBS 117.55]